MPPVSVKPPALSHQTGLWTDRNGVATYTRLAFDGANLDTHWAQLLEGITDDAQGAGAGMDLSVIAQLKGDQRLGLAIQSDALKYQTVFRSPCATSSPRLRVLAIAAETDIGGNTPLEFLLEGSDVELVWLYIIPGAPLPDPLPDHDVAIITIADDDRTRSALDVVKHLMPSWPRPILNRPGNIGELDRDRLFHLLKNIPGVEIPVTAKISKDQLENIATGTLSLQAVLPDARFPIIARPVGSHAGFGLAKLEGPDALRAYLRNREESLYFISRFVDYSSDDEQFRKYRIVMVDGRAYACHMAISDEWKLWYLNGDMVLNPANRAEEMQFMTMFDEMFGERHQTALHALAARIGLEYFTIDCAESKDGRLLIFEADHTAIVHAMDPPSIFPYKAPQMHKIFQAFVAMLFRHAGKAFERAA